MSENITTGVLPVLALRGLAVFPDQTVHFEVGRKKSVLALEEAMRKACFSLYQEMVFKEHLFTGMSPKAMACMEV